MTYRVDIHDRIDAEACLALWQGAATASVFNHPGWWLSAIAAFGAGRRLFVVWVHADDRPIAVWAFWRKTLGFKETFARVIEPVGARVTDHIAPVVAAGHDASQMAGLMLGALARHLDARTLVLWPKAPPAFDVTAIATSQSLLVRARPRVCLAIDLPATVDALEAQLPKRLRGDIRRQTRRLETFGPVTLWVAATPADVASHLPLLCQMHTRNWGERTGVSELGPGQPMVEFLTCLARQLPFELLHVSELRVADRPISGHFGFRWNGALMWYKPAFDIAWQGYSPGKLHIAFAARHGVHHELRELDLLQGAELYKEDWATSRRVTSSAAITNRLGYPLLTWTAGVRRMSAEYRT